MSVRTTAHRALVVFLLTMIVAGGCGDPYAEQRQPTAPPGERPAGPLPQRVEQVPRRAPGSTPEHAARRAAELTMNWTGETAARNYAELARITVGSARATARESAARLPSDPQLSAPGAQSTGTVEAIVVRSAALRTRDLIVVTRESLISDGLRQNRWRITLATAERRTGGWVVSRWQPQP